MKKFLTLLSLLTVFGLGYGISFSARNLQTSLVSIEAGMQEDLAGIKETQADKEQQWREIWKQKQESKKEQQRPQPAKKALYSKNKMIASADWRDVYSSHEKSKSEKSLAEQRALEQKQAWKEKEKRAWEKKNEMKKALEAKQSWKKTNGAAPGLTFVQKKMLEEKRKELQKEIEVYTMVKKFGEETGRSRKEQIKEWDREKALFEKGELFEKMKGVFPDSSLNESYRHAGTSYEEYRGSTKNDFLEEIEGEEKNLREKEAIIQSIKDEIQEMEKAFAAEQVSSKNDASYVKETSAPNNYENHSSNELVQKMRSKVSQMRSLVDHMEDVLDSLESSY